MVRLQSYLLSALSILLFVVIYHPTRCNPVQSLKSITTAVAARTLPVGAFEVYDAGLTRRFSNVLTIIAPSAVAANTLAEFYLTILARAIFEANAGSPERSNLFFSGGPLSLTFVADTWGKTIPWDFVAKFTLNMVDWTNRGFLATYDQGYWNVEGTLGVYAGLRTEGMGLPQ